MNAIGDDPSDDDGALTIRILGCGGSMGVPTLGGDWGNCDPTNPKNRRTRPSILVSKGKTRLLVDSSPDMREQLTAAGVTTIDAVLYTHDHADHCNGIDDLRLVYFRLGHAIPVYGTAETLTTLEARFSYLFLGHGRGDRLYKPFLDAKPIRAEQTLQIGEIEVRVLAQHHGPIVSLGFVFDGWLAYSTDVVDFPEASFAALAQIDTWIVDAVRVEPPHPTHAHLPITLDWIRMLRPRRAILTHMSHQFDYDEAVSNCPPGVEPGWDGMIIRRECAAVSE